MPGHVYVLTAGQTTDGVPIIKIGLTTRTPKTRARELSRGSPVAYDLAGSVATRDPKGLERKAHMRFASHRFNGGGGTEYFSVAPGEALDWLRREAAAHDAESLKSDAWKEYIDSQTWKRASRYDAAGILSGGVFFWWWLFHVASTDANYPWWAVVLAPLAAMVSGMWVFGWIKAKRFGAQLNSERERIEGKYYLRPGSLVA